MPNRDELIANAKAKFERDQLIDQAKAKWSAESSPEPKETGLLSDAASGISSGLRKIDSYTGAPVRKAIGSMQDGEGLIGGVKSAISQFGEDPSLAPTPRQIREKSGLDLGDNSFVDKKSIAGKIIRGSPFGFALTHTSPNDAAEFGIDAASDLTNILPLESALKYGAKGLVRGAEMAAEGGGKVLRKAGDALASGGRKALSGSLGVEESSIKKYLENHDRLKDIVNTNSGLVSIKNDLDETLDPLRTNVENATSRFSGAKERRAEELLGLSDKQREAKEALKLAEEQRLGETSAMVAGDVQRLNKEVSSGSEKSFKILDESGVKVPTASIKGDLTKGIKALDAAAVTDEQVKVVELLNRYRERLDKFGKEISGGEAKRLIQSLDREMKFIAPGEVGRLSREDQVLGILRRRFDAPLKEIPEYADQMKKVSADTRLLMSADGLATESGAARSLRAAKSPTGKDRAEVLRLLGERHGQDYLKAVDRSTLPEYQRLKGLLQRLRAAKKGSELKSAKAELDAAVNELAPYKSLAPNKYGVSGSESLIRNQLRPKTANIEKAGLIADIDKKFGKNFTGQIDDLKTISAFDKDFTRGSANTNFWSVALAGAGGLIGGMGGGLIGAGTGAMFGRQVVDRFGPQVARVILDQVPKLKAMPPVEWVKNLSVPEGVKKALLSELNQHNASNAVRGGLITSKALKDRGPEDGK